MRGFAHLGPRYVMDRLRWEYIHRRHPFEPYITREVVRHLDRVIRPGMAGLECGSGASTIWFTERCGSLVSVEHDPIWAARVRKNLADRGLSAKVDLRLCERRPETGTPDSYVEVVRDQKDDSLDFVLIDGKKRDSCALAALPKLKPGGLMIVDDIHRYLPHDPPSRTLFARGPENGYASETWEAFARHVAGWTCLWRTDGIAETAVWTRPATAYSGSARTQAES